MRDVLLDNLKFVLISLVIIGHVIEPVIGRFDWVKSIYVFIFIFHMPMFAYASGAVSSRNIDNSVVNNIVAKLLIPYLSLELIYSFFDYFMFSRDSLTISPLVPYWILWYLFSLAIWRLLLPIFNQLKFPVLFAILAGLACGINRFDFYLAFSRTFVFFPFFMIGHYYHLSVIKKIHNSGIIKIIGVGFIFVFFVVMLVIPENLDFNLGWIYGSRSYSRLGVDWLNGVFYRLLVYIAAIMLGLSVLSIIKTVRCAGTRYGEDSLYIYVLHGFFMKSLIAMGFYRYIDKGYKVVVLMVVSLLLLPLLRLPILKIICGNIMNPLGSLSNGGLARLVLHNQPEGNYSSARLKSRLGIGE
ncbi:acyltransferase family protein [Desulforhopalus singaporensis]|uniref:Fucose 4-O-acetylase n=1 Tax=Desulforhopalus singaporensis TaxID=91360 RepID=A0A1H0RNE6_9BACT|nr:acyltransferase family protein [Desulforhopalus singaporensis]SDP31022.1 Fucose 4-O-acetylase [Desulforhopalus singaporensis]